jgi:hypothetical protein
MERIDETVAKQLSRTGGGVGAALAEITGAWPEAVGEAVARNAWPLRIGRDGTLHVATSSSTWAFELDRLSPEIHERLAALVGEHAPAKLSFRVGPVPEPGAAFSEHSEPVAEAPPVAPEVAAEAASLASAIDDPDLREIVAKAARASLARARSGRRI